MSLFNQGMNIGIGVGLPSFDISSVNPEPITIVYLVDEQGVVLTDNDGNKLYTIEPTE